MFTVPDSLPAPPLIEPALITDLPPAPDRAAALRLAVAQLDRCGRLSDPEDVTAELLARESGEATALNNGFAIPHCRTGGVRFNSILIARLAEPVEWKAPDGWPVRVMVVLAIRRPDFDFDHLRVVARLCRLLMRPEFRARVAQRVPPPELCRQILAEVCPAPAEPVFV